MFQIDKKIKLGRMNNFNKYDTTSVSASRDKRIEQNLRLRGCTMAAVRRAFREQDYLEVDTPILRLREDPTDNPVFSTLAFSGWPRIHLRTCPEEYTRRAAACFGKAFEIGKSFRNTEIAADTSPRRHLVEFTHVEFYEKGDNLEAAIDLLWKVIRDVTQSLNLSTVTFNGKSISLAGEWQRLTIHQALCDASTPDCNKFVADHWSTKPPSNKDKQSKRLECLLDRHVRPKLIQPTFLLGFPSSADEYPDPVFDNIVQRAELNIGGMEIGEVALLETDVEKLRRHIEEALENRHGKNAGAVLLDEAYLHEIENLSSSIIGGGFGFDRLLMILANESDIRDVVWYPGVSEYFIRRKPS